MKKIKAAILIFDAMTGLLLFCLIMCRLPGGSGAAKMRNGWTDNAAGAAYGAEADVTAFDGKVGAEAGVTAFDGKVRAEAPSGDRAKEEEQKSEDDAQKKIALTFDDGPHPHYTEQLLDGLKERGVRATFFVTGEHAALHHDVILRMQEEGHLIGNHTYSHMQLRKNNREEFKAELIKTNEVIEGITGAEVEFVRPPYGSWDKSFEKELNMIPVLWTIDPLDWSSRDVSRITQKVVAKAGENEIILLHDYYDTSVTAALRIVDELLEEGYTFVTVDELLLDY